jgi:hypothetical protein
MAYRLGDGGMGVLFWHRSKVTVVWDCCFGIDGR